MVIYSYIYGDKLFNPIIPVQGFFNICLYSNDVPVSIGSNLFYTIML